ncbi:MAG: RNA polymerase sigma factor [Planctomycetes bacterium]|nr:RNA polymerase sigma factor [Planctomycetota bacterium]
MTEWENRVGEGWRRSLAEASGGLFAWAFSQAAGDREVAMDVAQETMRAALETAHPPRGETGPWLRGIARHKLADAWRARRRAVATLPPDLLDGMTPSRLDVLDEPSAATVRDAVRDALAAIPSDHREVLLSKYVEGRSQREIAVELGRTEEAVESLLARARQGFSGAFRRDVMEGRR